MCKLYDKHMKYVYEMLLLLPNYIRYCLSKILLKLNNWISLTYFVYIIIWGMSVWLKNVLFTFVIADTIKTWKIMT